MNRPLIKASIGIAALLSFSLLCSQSGNAVSLRIGDRKDTLTSNQKSLFAIETFSTFDNFEFSFSIEQENQIVVNDTFSGERQLLKLFLLDKQELSSLYSPQKAIVFSDTEFDNTIQVSSDRAEDVKLLNYITDALSNLEIETTTNSSPTDSEIIVLSQTSYQDIYQDVYSFEVDLSNSNFLETEGNLASASNATSPESSLDSENAPNLVFFQYSPYISNLSNYSSSASSSLSSGDINLPTNRNYGSDLSSKINEALVQPTNIFTNIPEIERQQRFNFRDHNKVKKDPKMSEIEQEIREEQQKRKQERQKIQQKLRREQQQRREERRRQQEQIRRERENRRRDRIRRQQEQMRRQQNSFR